MSGACVTGSVINERPIVKDFSELDRHIGEEITVAGFISMTHEAAGLYFKLNDLNAENRRCILPGALEKYKHGQKVVLSGFLKKTECGESLICTNVCDKYVLEYK